MQNILYVYSGFRTHVEDYFAESRIKNFAFAQKLFLFSVAPYNIPFIPGPKKVRSEYITIRLAFYARLRFLMIYMVGKKV